MGGANGVAGLHFFDTRIGRCGVAWTGRGIDRVQLPDTDAEGTERRLCAELPDRPAVAPPPPVRAAARRMARHFDGKLDALTDVAVDLSRATPFNRKVYQALRRVGPGKVVTYGELAGKAGRPGAARAIGRSMATNPVPLIVPCHRVLAADRKLGGFSSPCGVRQKAKMLFIEGVIPDERHAQGIEHLKRVDPKIADIINRAGPYLPEYGEGRDAWGALVEAIIHQQISMAAARTIAGRVRALTPGPGFPRPEEVMRLRDPRLRKAGLSRQKITYLRDLTASVTSGELPLKRLHRMDDDTVTERITRVKGFGRWSAQMFLLFHLGRLDVLPTDDLGFKKGLMKFHGLRDLPKPDKSERLCARWKPYRSMGTWYMWRSLGAGGI